MNHTSEAHTTTADEMQSVVDRSTLLPEAVNGKEEVPNMPWAEEEEALVIQSTFGSSSPGSTGRAAGHNIMFGIAFSAMATNVVRSAKLADKTTNTEPHKMYVLGLGLTRYSRRIAHNERRHNTPVRQNAINHCVLCGCSGPRTTRASLEPGRYNQGRTRRLWGRRFVQYNILLDRRLGGHHTRVISQTEDN